MTKKMTNKVLWIGGAGIAGISALATALMISPGNSVSADGKAAGTPKPSLLSRITKPRQEFLTLPEGLRISVRLAQAVSTEKNVPGDLFTATLDAPLSINGKIVAPAGSKASGLLTEVADSGRVEGRARMTMVLRQLEINGRQYSITTQPRSFEAQGTKKKDAGIIAGSAAVGAAIGAIAGGGKGAAIGAGVGGGSGTGYVLATKGKPVAFGPETRINFTLADSLELPVLPT